MKTCNVCGEDKPDEEFYKHGPQVCPKCGYHLIKAGIRRTCSRCVLQIRNEKRKGKLPAEGMIEITAGTTTVRGKKYPRRAHVRKDVRTMMVCPTCEGRARPSGIYKCSACNNTGRVPWKKHGNGE